MSQEAPTPAPPDRCTICGRKPNENADPDYSMDFLHATIDRHSGKIEHLCKNCYRQAEKSGAIEYEPEKRYLIDMRLRLVYLRKMQIDTACGRGKVGKKR